MTKQEQILLLVVITAVVTGGVMISGKANVDGASVKASADVTNSAMRRGLSDAYRPGSDDGDWQAPRWSILSSGSSLLRANHPLNRRANPGENTYKLQCGGWNSWYYDPPSEGYF
jgi:hypothetical protein